MSENKENQPSEKVSNLLGTPLSDEEKLKEVLKGAAKYSKIVQSRLEQINADLKILKMLPGMSKVIEKFEKDKENAFQYHETNKDWGKHALVLSQISKILHEEVISKQGANLEGLKTSGKQRGEYMKLTGDLQAMSDKIEAFPETGVAVTAIDKDLAKAKMLFEADQFAEAVKLLTLSKKTAEQYLGTQQANTKMVEKSSRLGPILKNLKEAGKILDEAERWLPDDSSKQLRKDAIMLHRDLLNAETVDEGDKKTKEKRADQNKNELVQRAPQTISQIEALRSGIDEAKKTAIQIEILVDQLTSDIATRGEYIPNKKNEGNDSKPSANDQRIAALATLDQVRDLVAKRSYAEALKAAQELDKVVKTWPEAPTTKKDEADRVRSMFLEPAEAELEKAQVLVGHLPKVPVLGTPPAVTDTVAGLSYQLEQYRIFPEAFPLSEALTVLLLATENNKENEKRRLAFEQTRSAREKANAQIDHAMLEVRTAIDETVKACGGSTAKTIGSDEEELQTILDEWTQTSNAAESENDLKLDVFLDRLAKLTEQINEEREDPTILKGKAAELKFNALTERFKAADEKAKKATEELEEHDYMQGSALGKRVVAAEAAFTQAVNKADANAAEQVIVALQKISTEAGDATETCIDHYRDVRNTFNERVNASTSRLNDVEALITNDKSGKCKEYGKLLNTLQTRLDLLRDTGESKNATVLEDSIEDLTTLQKDAGDLRALLTKIVEKTVNDKTDVTFASLRKGFDDLDSDWQKKKSIVAAAGHVDDEETKAIPIYVRIKTYRADFATAQATVDTAPLADSKTELASLTQRQSELIKQWDEFALAMKTNLAELLKLQKTLLSLVPQKQFPNLYASLYATWDGLQKAARTNALDEAAFKTFCAEIAEIDKNHALRDRRENSETTKALTEEVAKKKWEADSTAFPGLIKGLKKIASTLQGQAGRGFAEQIKQLEDSASVIKKSEGKMPYESMCEQLAALVNQADRMKEFPEGRSTAARGEIMPAIKSWNAAVKRFQAAVPSLTGAIEKALEDYGAPDVAQTALAAAKNRLAAVADLITEGSMDVAAEKVVKDIGNMSAARDAREQALLELKQLQRVIEGSPQLLPLPGADKPFKTALAAEIGNMQAALFSVETALAISL